MAKPFAEFDARRLRSACRASAVLMEVPTGGISTAGPALAANDYSVCFGWTTYSMSDFGLTY